VENGGAVANTEDKSSRLVPLGPEMHGITFRQAVFFFSISFFVVAVIFVIVVVSSTLY